MVCRETLGTEASLEPLFRVWEAEEAKPGRRGPSSAALGSSLGLQGQVRGRLQSSVAGGGMSCSWKFSFWKMLLKAEPLWEPPNGL